MAARVHAGSPSSTDLFPDSTPLSVCFSTQKETLVVSKSNMKCRRPEAVTESQVVSLTADRGLSL